MKLPWQKNTEFYVEEKPKRQKETVKSVGDKILIRQMKKQPDGFGLEMAKKEHGTPSEAKAGTTSELMNQMRELKDFEAEFMGDTNTGGGKKRRGGKGGMWSGEGTWISEVLNSQIVMQLASQLTMFLRRANKSAQDIGAMAPPPGMVTVIDAQGQIAQVPEESLKQLGAGTPTASPPKKLSVKEKPAKQIALPDADEMLAFLEYEPEALVEELRQRYNANDELAAYAISFLPTMTYKKLVTMIEPYQEHDKYGVVVKELLLETRREWLEKVLSGVMAAYREKQEAKNE